MATAGQAVQVVSGGWLDVPWIIWSGLISAVVASGVVAFTTRASSKNSLRLLAKQHARGGDEEANRQRQHDAKQKDEDRKGAIRREVYARAVEETHALLGYIGPVGQPLNAGNDADGFQSFLKTNAKIWLVAGAEAAHLSRDLAGDFAEVFLHEMATFYPIRKATEPVRRRREEIVFAEGAARRLISRLTNAKARNADLEEQEKLGDLAVRPMNT